MNSANTTKAITGANAHSDPSAPLEATQPVVTRRARKIRMRDTQINSIWVMLFGTTCVVSFLEKKLSTPLAPLDSFFLFRHRVAASVPMYERSTVAVPVDATVPGVVLKPVCHVTHALAHTNAGRPAPTSPRTRVAPAEAPTRALSRLLPSPVRERTNA